jgi:hypothetical protein
MATRSAHRRSWGLPDTTSSASPLARLGHSSGALAVLNRCTVEGDTVTSAGKILEILEALSLTGSSRTAAELVGCSHHTDARYVEQRVDGA